MQESEYLIVEINVAEGVFSDVVIPYSEITALNFGKRRNADGESTDESCLIIYHAPNGEGHTKIFGDYADAVYKHLTGLNGLGTIYRVRKTDARK